MSRAPGFADSELEEVELSTRGRLWSYTDAQYQPPEPYVPVTEPHVAVLHRRGGARGGADWWSWARSSPAWRSTTCRSAWRWSWCWTPSTWSATKRPTRTSRSWCGSGAPVATSPAGGTRAGEGSQLMAVEQVAVLGVGMHPWGKWGRNFVEYGVAAARDALDDAGIDWPTSASSPAPTPCATATPATWPGPPSPRPWAGPGIPVTSAYGACASGAMALDAARQRILSGMCDVALVVGADTTPKGFLKPNAGERGDDPDWLRFRLLGATNPTYFATVRPASHRPLRRHRGRLRRGEGQERPARPGQPLRPVPQGGHRGRRRRLADGGQPAAPARHLRHLRRRRRGGPDLDGLRPPPPARGRPRACGWPRSPRSPPRSPTPSSRCPNFATDSAAGIPAPERTFKQAIGDAAYEQAGLGPDDVDVAEVYDLSTALELDWYEDLGFCGPGEAEKLLRDGVTTLGGRLPGEPVGRAGVLRRGGARPRPWPRCASSPGSSGARPRDARPTTPGRREPTRVCSDHGSSVQGLFGHGSLRGPHPLRAGRRHRDQGGTPGARTRPLRDWAMAHCPGVAAGTSRRDRGRSRARGHGLVTRDRRPAATSGAGRLDGVRRPGREHGPGRCPPCCTSRWASPRPAVRRRRARGGPRPRSTGPLGYTDALGTAVLRGRIAGLYLGRHGLDVAPDRIAVTSGASAGACS